MSDIKGQIEGHPDFHNLGDVLFAPLMPYVS